MRNPIKGARLVDRPALKKRGAGQPIYPYDLIIKTADLPNKAVMIPLNGVKHTRIRASMYFTLSRRGYKAHTSADKYAVYVWVEPKKGDKP